eukprot:NODE_1928_length_694_cov_88.961199_g1878_i0.p1 GENE.NODE_1928_length_694_cov_88.961199_g1878_i0~~NODE_1928_length_694_cov_88.961199_g1878_i0.p1  ORF type:complete len:141 (-),score=30.30 NODE_1928_length_694_cov_88.961199_g1878_i0:164-586(-)
MSAFEIATKFFHACESMKGWDGCSEFVADGATFRAQAAPLDDVKTVQGYADWMKGFGQGPCGGKCTYTLVTSSYDEANKKSSFFGIFHGKHCADGGPVPPTNKEVDADYVYVFTHGDDGKITDMVKIWNAPHSLAGFGWA